jgi:ABC-type multidrug transport system ATPase subunit
MSVIKVEEVSKVYRRSKGEPIYAVDKVSFEVNQGQIFGLLGPNGAGKSTLVKILNTLTTPTSGAASVCGFDVVRQPLAVRRQIAVVLQQTAVETLLTVEDNLRIYAYLHGMSTSAANRRIDAVLDEFELRENARETAQDLSIGTKRRVQVAKIFLIDAPVIFLDECTTGMDPFMRRRVLERVRREARNGRTVLLTTQVLSEAEQLCDTIMIIDHGKMLAAGSLPELRRLATNMFRVNLTFASADGFDSQLKALRPAELRIEGTQVEMLFKGEESALLQKLAAVSRTAPIVHFEVRGAGLEDIFVELVGEKLSGAEREVGT